MIILALIIVPFVAAGVVYTQRQHRTVAAVFFAVAIAVQVVLLTRLGLRIPVAYGELQLVVDELTRSALLVLATCSLVLAACGWHRPQGDDFLPFLMLMHGMATVALASSSVFVSVFLLAGLGATLSLLLSRLRVGGVVAGAMRPLVIATVSGGCLAFALLLAGLYRESPNTFVLTKVVVGAMSFGLALSLSIVPFHVSLLSSLRQAREGALGAALVYAPTVAIVVLLRLTAAFPWLLSSLKVNEVLLAALMASALAAALLALTAKDAGIAVAYSAAGSLALVASLGVLTPVWAPTALLFGTLAHLSGVLLLVLVLAASSMRRGEERPEPQGALASLRGRLLVVAVVLGALTVAGLPPSGAFPSRWLLYRGLTSGDHPFVLLAAAAAGVLLALAMDRTYYRMWKGRLNRTPGGWTGTAIMLVLAGLIAMNLAAGVLPAPVYTYLSDVARFLTVAPY